MKDVVYLSDEYIKKCNYEIVNDKIGKLLILDGKEYRIKSAMSNGYNVYETIKPFIR